MTKPKRGQAVVDYQKRRSLEFKRAVEAYFEANPFSDLKECAEAVGISYASARKYFAELRRERKSPNKK